MRASPQLMVHRAIVCFVLLGSSVAGPLRADGLLGASAEGVTLTEYGDVQPILRLQATRIFVDHEKYGFFRFGLAPLAVVQDVKIQVESAGCLTNVLDKLNSSYLPLAAESKFRHLEFRNVEISLMTDKEPRLCAATARANAAGDLVLYKVSVSAGSAPLTISKATLKITGPNAGCLSWRSGDKDSELFLLKPSKP